MQAGRTGGNLPISWQIMFYGHPLERLCTYQYSLVTLMPGETLSLNVSLLGLTLVVGLLQNLDDCGSPPLAARAPTLTRPSSLKTSNHKSMMAYLGLPLDLFGKACVSLLVSNSVDKLLLGRTPSFNPIFPYNNWIWSRKVKAGYAGLRIRS